MSRVHAKKKKSNLNSKTFLSIIDFYSLLKQTSELMVYLMLNDQSRSWKSAKSGNSAKDLPTDYVKQLRQRFTC